MKNIAKSFVVAAAIAALLSGPVPALGADSAGSGMGVSPTAPAAADDLHAQLEVAKKAAALIETSPNYAANAPAGASEDDLKFRRYYANETVRAYEAAIRNASRKNELRQALEDAKRRAEQFETVQGGPPYSVLLADKLAQEAQSAEANVASKKTRQELTRGTRDSLSFTVKNSAAAVRQLEEQASQAGGAQKIAQDWALELARYRLRGQAAILKSLELAEEVAQLEIAIAQATAMLAQRRMDSIRGKVAFPQSDATQIKANLAADSTAISQELTRAIDGAAVAARRLEMARQALAQAEAEAAGGPRRGKQPPETLDTLRQNVALADVDVAAANATLDVLRFKPGANELKKTIWESRYRLYNERTPELAAQVKGKLAEWSESLSVLQRVTERRKTVLLGEITEIEQALQSVADSAEIRQLQTRMLARAMEREKTLRQVGSHYGSVQFLMDRVKDELQGETERLDAGDRATVLALSARELLAKAWDFEIFAIEDTVDVDGRKVTSLASVTVGKVVRAIAIFTAGVLLSFWLARGIEILVVRYFGYEAARARILRKWLYALGLLILFMLVLLWVRIPLTVFAFLGGAIAIGLGFGMQNVLKNLISGLMLLFERPFKPGDLVEVGPIRGNIVDVGIRSSVIRDANGVDSLIPNSTFVEQAVTNWTYENPKVRFCIKVGVAYGSPAEDVVRLLEQCVAQHGLVLKDPPAEVLFENFGADALEFAIYYWLELGPKVVPRRVSSELRLIIDKVLGEQHITIAYPQRDVHVDAGAPLRIQLVKE